MILPQYDDHSEGHIFKKYSLQLRRWDKYIKMALETTSNYPNAESIPYLPDEFWREEYGDINVITRLMCVERALAEQKDFHIVYKQYKQFIKNIENDIESEKEKTQGNVYKKNKSKSKKKKKQKQKQNVNLGKDYSNDVSELRKDDFIHPKNINRDQHLISAGYRCLNCVMANTWIHFHFSCGTDKYNKSSLQERYAQFCKKTTDILKERLRVCKQKKEIVSDDIAKRVNNVENTTSTKDEGISEENEISNISINTKVAEEKEETEYNDYEEYDEYEQMSKYEQIHTKHRNNIQASKKKRKSRTKQKKEARAKQKIMLQQPKVSKQMEVYEKSKTLDDTKLINHFEKENANLNSKQNEVHSSKNMYSKEERRELYPKDVFQKWMYPTQNTTSKKNWSQVPNELYRNTTTSFENKTSLDEIKQEYAQKLQQCETTECAPWITKEESYKGEIHRGDIFWVDLPYTSGQGHKKRPCIILQNDYENAYALTFTVLPITSKVRMTELINHIPIKLEKDSMIKVENITTVNRELFVSYCGHVSWKQMREISYALFVHLGYF